jgi:two-component system, cell cycle response regulator
MLEDLPQVLVLDGFGNGGQGEALCRHLRQARLGRNLYVVALTESIDKLVLAAVFDAGADDFLVKPVNPCVLDGRLRAGLRVIGLQEEAHRDKEEMRRFAMELAVANRRLQLAAYEDALTKLPNRRCALERLAQEWSRATRTDRALACIVADLDHFKRVNDTYGHDIGDLVLQETAKLMRGTIRSTDLACRLGGEEFVILCPDADVKGAKQCAERLCGHLAAHRIHLPKAEIGVTVSLGVAARESGMRHSSDLLKKADQAMYLAKQSGRNRVCIL